MKIHVVEVIVLAAAVVIEGWTIASGNFNPVWDIPLMALIAYVLVKKYKAGQAEKKK